MCQEVGLFLRKSCFKGRFFSPGVVVFACFFVLGGRNFRFFVVFKLLACIVY